MTTTPRAPTGSEPVTTGGPPARPGATRPTTGRACTSTTPFDVLLAMFPRLGVGPDDRAARHRVRLRARGPPRRRRSGATVAGIDAADATDRDRPRPHARGRPPRRLDVRAALGRRDRSTSRSRSTGSGVAARTRSARRTGCCDRADGSASASGARVRRSTSASSSASSRVHAPDAHRGSMRRLNDISVPGVAETMLTAAGSRSSNAARASR